MGKIRRLPELLAHQIAAGEIVERPASVVKELMENALDAESHRIVIEAKAGGKNLIRVQDDGIGMGPEDARLAFEHHATSKIREIEDLNRLRTLGFRGEALPSIAAVSRLRLRTVERLQGGPAPLGTELRYEGGRLTGEAEAAWPRGTEIRVEDLFYNVPARRKFLKTDSTELSHFSRQVMQYALAYPEVEFGFHHQGRTIFEAPAVGSLQERIYQVQGEAFLENLVPVEYQKDGIRVWGFTSLPHEQRSSANAQFLYVNRRMVRDRMLTHALHQAYQNLMPAQAHPAVILFLEIDPAQIDVNVHPAKIEIRFQNSGAVHRALFHGIEAALLQQSREVFQRAPLASFRPAAPSSPIDGMAHGIQRALQGPLAVAEAAGGGSSYSAERPVPYSPLLLDRPMTARSSGGGTHADEIPQTDYISAVPVALGQFVESFVVAADREGVLLIDQHVAHERILYERALAALEAPQPCATQRLLVPLTFELNPQQKAFLEELLRELNANGFEVEWFGDQTLVIKGVPAFAEGCDARALIQDVLENLEGEERAGQAQDARAQRVRERIAIGASCRAAIKINTPLSGEKMQWLLDELFRCQNPFTCPHGRPIVLRMGIEEVLRRFQRI